MDGPVATKDTDTSNSPPSKSPPHFRLLTPAPSFDGSEKRELVTSPSSEVPLSPPRGRTAVHFDPVPQYAPTKRPPLAPDDSDSDAEEEDASPERPVKYRTYSVESLSVPSDRASSTGRVRERRRSLSAMGSRALSPRRALLDDGAPLSAIGYALMKTMKRPERVDGKPPKLRDAAQYWIRLRKLRSFISLWLSSRKNTTLCGDCEKLGLTDEHFITSSEVATNSEARKVPSQMSRGPRRVELGNLRHISMKSWNCSMCRLIIQSLKEQGDRFDLLHSDVKFFGFPDSLKEHEKSKCYVSWHTDDRTRPVGGPRLAPIGGNNVRTKRLKIEWQDAKIEPCYIGKIEHPFGKGQSGNPLVYLDSTSQPTAIAVVRDWLGRCRRDHGTPCQIQRDGVSHERNKQAFFGVIDLTEMRLTRLEPGSRYVALSYTWGNQNDFKCNRSNIRDLQRFEGIMKILSRLPKVIQDAMELTRGLGERYLWVDALCIVQDSHMSWQLNANIMDQVYSHATCTICAADGADAMTGLIALSSDKLNRKRHERSISTYSRGIDLMASYPAEYYIKKSAWNTRAWTFQERLLSRRCIIFAGGKIFFQCGSMTLREEIFAGDNNGWPAEMRGTPADLVADIKSRPLKVYTECVELYTLRFLTKENDILNAFQGVGHVMSQVLGNRGTIFGLPRSHLDWALLWQSKGRSTYRGAQTDETGGKAVEDMPSDFPTWSWAGWYSAEKGQALRSGRGAIYRPGTMVGTTTNVRDWLRRHTWITWYIRDGKGDLKLVWTPTEPHQWTLDSKSRWAGYQMPDDYNAKFTRDPYGRLLGSRREIPQASRSEQKQAKGQIPGPPQAPKFELTLEEFPYSVSVTDDLGECGSGLDVNYPDLRYLQFFTWSAHFELEQFDRFEEQLDSEDLVERGLQVPLRTEPDPRWAILDRHGELVGVITPDRTSWSPGDGASYFDLYTGQHQFLAISDAKEFSSEEAEGWTEYLSTEAEGVEWNLYYVLLVAKVRGVCHRIGLGKIYRDAFDDASKWEEIIFG